jgi:hypothetical protein
MSKYPSSFKDCIKGTRPLEEGGVELGHSPRIDEDDKTRLVYYNYGTEEPEIVEVKFEDDKDPVYKDIKVEHLTRPNKVKGNLMLYTSTFPENNALMACWYRFDKNKSYCPATHDWSASMLFPTFTEKWQIYKGSVSYTLRDWECYCKETGICPFE